MFVVIHNFIENYITVDADLHLKLYNEEESAMSLEGIDGNGYESVEEAKEDGYTKPIIYLFTWRKGAYNPVKMSTFINSLEKAKQDCGQDLEVLYSHETGDAWYALENITTIDVPGFR